MTGTSSDRLRETVARATIPLLADYRTLTMAQIAEAASVEEADLLAVFPDKEAVMEACTATIMAHVGATIDPTDDIRRLDAISLDQPVEARLIEALGIIDAYYRRIRADYLAFEQEIHRGAAAADAPAAPDSGRNEIGYLGSTPEARQAVTRLLEPDSQGLRLPPEVLADAFLDLCSAGARVPNETRSPLPAEHLVDLFLHGALLTR